MLAGTGSCPLYGRQSAVCVDGKGREFVYICVWEGPVEGGGQSEPICLSDPPQLRRNQKGFPGSHLMLLLSCAKIDVLLLQIVIEIEKIRGRCLFWSWLVKDQILGTQTSFLLHTCLYIEGCQNPLTIHVLCVFRVSVSPT